MIEASASSESGLSVVGQLKVLRSHPVMARVSGAGAGQEGAKLGKKTLGQSAARVSQNWI